MDQIQPAATMPHIVQVYPTSVADPKIQNPQIIHISHSSLPTNLPSKLTYQPTLTPETLSMPVVSEVDSHVHSHIVISCHQSQIQNTQPITMQSQVLQPDMHSLQFTSHMILPQLPLLKQPVLIENLPYYPQYNCVKQNFDKTEENCTIFVETKLSTQNQNDQKTQMQKQAETDIVKQKNRKRSAQPNPNSWAHNVRKIKHQSGEAYVSRRGKYVPAKQIKTTKDCLKNCKYKCNKKICDSDRELIFKAFYSLSSNEKKHFLLNTTERHDVKNQSDDGNGKRLHYFKYFFLVRGTRHTVCRNFYLGTLSISPKPVYNVHAGKSELNIPKPDGRGQSSSSVHCLPVNTKNCVREHIMSFKTIDSQFVKQFSKKKQVLQENLTVKEMYNMYLSECSNKNVFAVRESMYRKILKQEFNILLVKTKSDQLCANCKEPIRKKSTEK